MYPSGVMLKGDCTWKYAGDNVFSEKKNAYFCV